MFRSIFPHLTIALLLCNGTFTQAQTTETQTKETSDAGWIELFNGKNLDGWTPKIRRYKLGENYADTFRVEDGVIKVAYDKYEGKFDGRFGHLFYKDAFENYDLQMEYRIVGQQHEGGAGWAIRNSGVMLHGQDPKTMGLNQEFPVSLEAQFLGSAEDRKRTTLNLCTPGTNVRLHGKLFKKHCTDSKSKNYFGDQWVKCEFEVRGNRYIKHKIDGKLVFEYFQPQYDPKDKTAKPLIKDGNLMISSGTISLQSESHPVEFRNIRLKDFGKSEVDSK